MTASGDSSSQPSGLTQRLRQAVPVLIVSSVTFTFISYWRTAAWSSATWRAPSTTSAASSRMPSGPAAPWFFLPSCCLAMPCAQSYIESCSLFVRGGRLSRRQGSHGRLSRQAVRLGTHVRLYFSRCPTSGRFCRPVHHGPHPPIREHGGARLVQNRCSSISKIPVQVGEAVIRWGSVLLAVCITLFFLRQNLLGLHESRRQSPQDHDRDHDHGGHHHYVVRRDAARSRTGPKAFPSCPT